MIYTSGIRILHFGCKIYGVGFKAQGTGFTVKAHRFRGSRHLGNRHTFHKVSQAAKYVSNDVPGIEVRHPRRFGNPGNRAKIVQMCFIVPVSAFNLQDYESQA